MSLVLELIKKGDFNSIAVERQSGNSVEITLSQNDNPVCYQALIKDYQLPTQEVIWEKEIPA